MSAGKMKNMIILKNLPSNIVDEAIVILKPNINIKETVQKNRQKSETSRREEQDYIVNEAQMVISNYISSLETRSKMKQENTKIKRNKQGVLKTALIVLGVLSLANIFLFRVL